MFFVCLFVCFFIIIETIIWQACSFSEISSLRKQSTFRDPTVHWFPCEWSLRNKRRNSGVLTIRHFPDLGSSSDSLKQMHCQIWIVYSDTSRVWNFCACSSAVIRGDTHANVSIAKCRLLPQAWAANKSVFLVIQVRANSQTKGLELGSDAKNTLRGVWGALEALTLLLRHTKSILRRKK